MLEGPGRLTARPVVAPQAKPPDPGLHELGLGGRRDGLVYVPRSYAPGRPAGFVLMLHGAGSGARPGIGPFLRHAERERLILLAPDSRGGTWDVIYGEYGPDVGFVDRALGWAFERFAIDTDRVAIEGFSDGASYALSLGLTNGDLFTHVIAFSPGFMAPAANIGRPRIFISHGIDDPVLPIRATSRRLVRRLRAAGYSVHYREFDGRHAAPHEMVVDALDWLDA